MAQRTRGWARRLQQLVVERLDMPFGWGMNDCVAFVCDAVLVQHEADTLAPLRLPRSTALQAARQIRKVHGPVVLSHCGLQPLTASLAGVGDVVLVQQRVQGKRGQRYLLGVCNGTEVLSPGRNGLMATPTWQAVAAWRV